MTLQGPIDISERALDPVCHASRHASAARPLATVSRICQACGRDYTGSSRPSQYCSDTCRQRASRARRRQPVLPAIPPRSPHLDVVYVCDGCDERLLNEQRCEDCNRFARRLGVAVSCPCCDEPILLSELLEQLR